MSQRMRMKQGYRYFFAAVLMVVGIGVPVILKMGQGHNFNPTNAVRNLFETESARREHNPGVTGVMSAQTQKPPEKLLSILFIGNSYTFYNNMPGMVIEIAKADAGNTVALDIQAVTQGAVSLQDLWDKPEARTVIKERLWDFTVLQDNSFWALLQGNREQTTTATTQWANEIRASGGTPVLVLTWPREPGSDWYNNPQYTFIKTPDHYYQTFKIETARLARAVDAVAVPVGDFWYFAVQQYPELKLYEPDGSHPSLQGSYMQALLFYRHFTGRSPEGTTYAPAGIPEDKAKLIRKIAAYQGF